MAREITYMPLKVMSPECDSATGFVKLPFIISEKLVVIMDIPVRDAVKLALQILKSVPQSTIEEVVARE